MLEEFKTGNTELVNRLNELVSIARQVQNMSGDDTIQVRHTANGINISMNRRIQNASGGGGSEVVWVEVVRGLLSADPDRDEADGPVEGYSDYVCRLATDSVGEWLIGITYQTGDVRIGSDDRKYISLRDENTGNDPISSSDWWTIQDEISPRVISRPTETDMRLFAVWYKEGRTVPVITRDGVYYFYQDLIYSNNGSLMWNETDERSMAVYG